ncbi:MAG: ribonuclease HII [Nitrospirae bacterium]|nr:MAG: ribonuclease HII [Nitrospirota bacterium]
MGRGRRRWTVPTGGAVVPPGAEAAPDPDHLDAAFARANPGPLAGVDEAGRGPLAGPVVAAAVVLPEGVRFPGLDDSKRVAPRARERLYEAITGAARAWAVGQASPAEIDRMNILEAARLAMVRAVAGLGVAPGLVLVDAMELPLPLPQVALVKGDRRSAAVAAASIVAKVTRDRIMEGYGRTYPGYGFEVHKGYPTRAHKEAVARLGPCPIHRRSFRGVSHVAAAG